MGHHAESELHRHRVGAVGASRARCATCQPQSPEWRPMRAPADAEAEVVTGGVRRLRQRNSEPPPQNRSRRLAAVEGPSKCWDEETARAKDGPGWVAFHQGRVGFAQV